MTASPASGAARTQLPSPPLPEETRASRPPRPQRVFVLERTEVLTPHLVRVHLGGEAFAPFIDNASERLGATDKYVKLLFARPGLGLVPPFDLDALREVLSLEDMPVRRTYTVRSVDRDTQTIAIDFVVHGAEGIAGPWAAHAQPGDLLALTGPGGGYTPTDDPATEQLLLGDDSAIPAIAAALEAMHPDAAGRAILEVDGPADELPLRAPAGVELVWLHRDAGDGAVAEAGVPLTSAVRELPRPTGPIQIFAHGERSAMQSIRSVLQDDWGLERRALSLSAYWALGRAEDAFQAEKREPVGQIFAD